jgi:hypothetical protein
MSTDSSFGELPSCSHQFSGGGPFSEISILPICSPSCQFAVDHKATDHLGLTVVMEILARIPVHLQRMIMATMS